MSDTRRWTQPGYNLESVFRGTEDGKDIKEVKIHSKKHQQADHRSYGSRGGKKGRFINGLGVVKNCLYNLRAKVRGLRLKEAMSDLDTPDGD